MARSETTPVDPGDIYWISLPSRGGREQEGRRPCIVISRRAVNHGNPIVVVPMTTNTSKASSYNIAVPAAEIVRDVSSKTTIVDSVALCGQVFAVDKRKLEDKLGKLSHKAVLPFNLGCRTSSISAKFQTEPLPLFRPALQLAAVVVQFQIFDSWSTCALACEKLRSRGRLRSNFELKTEPVTTTLAVLGTIRCSLQLFAPIQAFAQMLLQYLAAGVSGQRFRTQDEELRDFEVCQMLFGEAGYLRRIRG
jgi:mRNA-degrading endonuclease toxin of MazEF toxin-antitoxin module